MPGQGKSGVATASILDLRHSFVYRFRVLFLAFKALDPTGRFLLLGLGPFFEALERASLVPSKSRLAH